MKHFIRQAVTMMMVTVLGISSMVQPITIKAQENSPIIEKGIAPAIVLPENLKAKEGTSLKEIQLPEQWTWTDESILVSKDTREYPACLKVDDETYNYETIEGYNPEKHDVEVLLTVIIEEPELTNPIQKAETPTTLAEGDVEINETNFPDATFREYLKNDSTINPGGNNILTAAEIATVFKIDVSNKKEITDLTGIGYFTNLTSLYCNGTGITALNVSENEALVILNCSYTSITSLNVNQNKMLKNLNCQGCEKITELNVSSNTALTDLYCSGTGISTLKVDNNSSLSKLHCYTTKINSLDVSANLNLEVLFCSGTYITELDVSKNKKLTNLQVYDTKITGLDVSENVALTNLNCSNTSLAYLNLGDNADLITLNKPSETVMELKETGTSFNISDKFPGFDISKVLSIEGATYDATTGIVSDYKLGTPIIYEYDCGTANNGAQTLKVTLTSVGESTITFNDELSKDYDGTAVTDKPDVTVTGSKGPVTYTWEKQNGSNWDTIATAPTDAGTYRVSAKVEADANYKEATAFEIFTILPAMNSITITETLDKTYDKSPVNSAPSVDKTGGGTVSYTWEKQNGSNWDTIATAPTDAGTYRVTAKVEADANYKEATSSAVEFVISLADSTIEISKTLDLNKQYDGTAVTDKPDVTVTGSKGPVTYTWEKQNGSNWETITTIPSDAGVYRVSAKVEANANYKEATSLPLEFTIAQATNSWDEELSITGWIYNETAITPTAKATFGDVVFTYSDKQDGTYTDTIPTMAGTYYVKASVVGSDNYTGLESIKTFTIAQATNSWTEELSLTGWTYNEGTNTPSATAKFGDVVFTYSNKQDGTYTDTVPTNAGTWYVKASVVGSDNYTGLESIKTFVIEPKNTDDIKVSEINKDTKLDEIIVNDGNTILVIGKDYDITKKQEGNQVTVTITLKGNYTGTITQTYTIESDKPIEPDKPNKPTEPTNENKQENTTTKTGDTTNIQGWIMLMIGAVGVMVVVRKKKKEE